MGAAAYAAALPDGASYSALTGTSVLRAQNNLAHIRSLVEQGALPRKSIADAQTALADAQDEQILLDTLFGGIYAQSLSPEQARRMVDAAARRVNREQALVDDRAQLVESGTLARGEVQPLTIELEMRRRSLALARNRAKLVDQLVAMATAEQALERANNTKAVMIRYEGSTPFSMSGLPAIEASFEQRFHGHLPISALGQTLVHQELGFDHRGRVDVALNPESTQGLWLRHFLEAHRIPYIAFRSAVVGSATAPHIHIGAGSVRVKVAPGPDTYHTAHLANRPGTLGVLAHGS